jgi:hypothetical protein
VTDLGDKRTMEFAISAREIADALARELTLDKPRLNDPKPHEECPARAEKIKPGAAVCRSPRASQGIPEPINPNQANIHSQAKD